MVPSWMFRLCTAWPTSRPLSTLTDKNTLKTQKFYGIVITIIIILIRYISKIYAKSWWENIYGQQYKQMPYTKIVICWGQVDSYTHFFYKKLEFPHSLNVAEQKVVGALRTTLLLGTPMVNKFQDPETETLTMSFLRISSP